MGRSLFRDIASEFLADYQSRKPRGRTMSFQIDLLGREFGDMPIDQVGPRQVTAFFARRRAAGTNGATCNRQLSALNTLFKWAVTMNILPANPIAGMQRYEENPKEARTLTPAQCEQLILAASPHAKAYLIHLAYAGGRMTETVELIWDWFDFEKNRFAFVRETTKGLKTRWIPMPPVLREAMLAIRPARVQPGQRVFLYNGQPVKSMRRALRTAARRAGLPRIGFHVLRHSFATWFLERSGRGEAAGDRLVLLQRILGHSTITMTMRYVHSSPEFTANAIDFMGPRAQREDDSEEGDG